MLRIPAVAGRFYKGNPESLKKQIAEFVIPAERRNAIGIMSPHAGFQYSGTVAGAVYSSIHLPDTIVLIGPNHTGFGAAVSIMTKGEWETPLGTVPIDEQLAASILSKSRRMYEDTLAHVQEHSLEVQLPFIQYFKTDFKIVPIQMLDTRLDTCLEVGKAIGEAIQELSKQSRLNALIVASSDMTHYESAAVAKENDFKAIQKILSLDPEGLYKTVKQLAITMCGVGPTVAMLVAAKLLGATKAELIKYANSGDVSGDYNQVVGYAGVVIG
ncbi:MAG: AmmeMemoRadiSam system protein B [Nitrospirota bacterium]